MAISTSAEATFEWIAKIIGTCYTPFHLECVTTLVERFRERYGECEYWHRLLELVNAKGPMVTVG